MSYIKEKTGNKGLNSLNETYTGLVNVFNGDKDIFIFKKTERITSAAHLLTRHISETEPVRLIVREKAITLFTSVTKTLRTSGGVDTVFAQNALSEFIGVLTIARDTGYISDQNYILMQQACGECAEHLAERMRDQNENGYIEKYLKDTDGEESALLRTEKKVSQSTKTQDGFVKKDTQASKKDIIKDSVSHTHSGLSKDDRKAIIRNVIKREKKVSIKDISAVITDCSEKTLQRDLNELVEENVLKKEGKRRWSRYLLV